MRMRSELRKRFIDSIEYLRKMDFFKDYSDLTSEEILEKIFEGEIDYEVHWFVETWPEEEQRKERGTRGRYLRESLEEREDYWMNASDFKVDEELSFFDVHRVFVEDTKAVIRKGMCEILLRKLARISRDVFNPRYIREEMLKWEEPPPALGKAYFSGGWIFRILFEFRGKEHLVEFYSDGKYLFMNPAIKMINELIKDTGYQYYHIPDFDYTVYGVFSEDEAVKLKRERGWKLYLP
ncbi:MAG: hypothetical protein FGF48_11065 [Candidatus Brockarchaeota archaeon]|nr:hypothetical protein [Candidatus Brockarchaeota archaeon]